MVWRFEMTAGLIITAIGMVTVFSLLVLMVGAVKLLSMFDSGKLLFTKSSNRDKEIAIAIAALRHSMG